MEGPKTPERTGDMYTNPELVRKFAELQQNEKNFRVSEILDTLVVHEMEAYQGPLKVAELGGGAHIDRYHRFFNLLLSRPGSTVDWVDNSSHMLDLAREYLHENLYTERQKVIRLVESDMIAYLTALPDNSLDVAVMKYSIGHIADLNTLFSVLSKKLKAEGKLIAIIGDTKPELKSISTNARFFYNGETFPEDETRLLKDGDSYDIHFFKVSGDPSAGYLEGARTTKYYHSQAKIRDLGGRNGFNVFVGDWRDYPEEIDLEETMDQEVVVLRKMPKVTTGFSSSIIFSHI